MAHAALGVDPSDEFPLTMPVQSPAVIHSDPLALLILPTAALLLFSRRLFRKSWRITVL